MLTLSMGRPLARARCFSVIRSVAGAAGAARFAGLLGALALVAFAPLAIPDIASLSGGAVPVIAAMQHWTFMAFGFGLVALNVRDVVRRLAGGRRAVGYLAVALLVAQTVATAASLIVPAEVVVTIVTTNAFGFVAAALLAVVTAGRVGAAYAVSAAGLAAAALVTVEAQVGPIGRLIALAIGFGFAVGALAADERRA